MSTILEGIGNTPMVRINNIGKSCGIKCEICKFIRVSQEDFSTSNIK